VGHNLMRYRAADVAAELLALLDRAAPAAPPG
jgi:hypothetical protein